MTLDALPARAAVILDDMHWADPESLELSGQLAQADCGLFSDARGTLEAAVSLLEQRADGSEAVAELVWAVGPGVLGRSLGFGDHRPVD